MTLTNAPTCNSSRLYPWRSRAILASIVTSQSSVAPSSLVTSSTKEQCGFTKFVEVIVTSSEINYWEKLRAVEWWALRTAGADNKSTKNKFLRIIMNCYLSPYLAFSGVQPYTVTSKSDFK